MTKQTRHNVFETNSSSSHSLTIDQAISEESLQTIYPTRTIYPTDMGNAIDYNTKNDGFFLNTKPIKTFVIGSSGETEFGWKFNDYTDPYSKINYAWLQVEAMRSSAEKGNRTAAIDFNKCNSLLMEVIKEHAGVDQVVSSITTKFSDKYSKNKIWGFIDHQSNYLEDDLWKDIFASKESLRNFLFSRNSILSTGNDNV